MEFGHQFNNTGTPGVMLNRQLTWRTFLIPMLFLAMHLFFSTVISALYIFGYIFVQAAIGAADLGTLLADPFALSDIIVTHYPVISAILSVALIPVCLVYLRLTARRDPRTWLTGKFRPSDMLASLAMMVGVIGVVNIYLNLLVSLGESSPLIQKMLNDYEQQSAAFTAETGYFWLILGISVLTPVLEELIFRGVIQGELRKAMPEWAAIIIQAVVFAAYHMQPVQSSYVLLPGLLLGLAYYWSRSIWVPIAMHCLFNFLGSALPMMIGENEAALNILVYTEMGFIVIGLAAGIYMLLSRRQVNAIQH
ncbi:MAG TPA: hypothetical protein DCM45_07325 [Clostridiales bacterium]|nr:hypothetical protein [Clostridiales bacterium]